MTAVETLGVAALGVWLGERAVHHIPILERFHVPGAVVGGMGLAGIAALWGGISWDTTFQTPLMIAFFASVGWAASWRMLIHGGRKMIEFFAISTVAMIAQAALGVAVSRALGQSALLGVITGPAALAGGPGTTLAFAPLFEQAGLIGAREAGLVCAFCGILVGGIVGPMLGTWIYRADARSKPLHLRTTPAQDLVFEEFGPSRSKGGELRGATYLYWLISMGVGSLLMAVFARWGVTLPVYFGAMLCGAIGRTFLEKKIDLEELESASSTVLSLFVCMAIMTLNLRQLTGMGGILFLLFSAQFVLTVILSVAVGVFWARGGKEGAFFGAGFFGFMMGTTANALSNMHGLSRNLGPSRRAFLIVPLVGACFIDFTNAALLTFCLKIFGQA